MLLGADYVLLCKLSQQLRKAMVSNLITWAVTPDLAVVWHGAGITAASGICADLGIPLTHRGIATSVRFLTGHSREGDEAQLDASIAACADPQTTLVVYMGLGTLPALTQQLTSAGLSPGTPAVAIERGTTSAQRTVWAPVDHLCDDVEEAKLQSPTLVIIGEVVGLAQGWRHADSTGQQQRASWSEFREIWEAQSEADAQQGQQPSREPSTVA